MDECWGNDRDRDFKEICYACNSDFNNSKGIRPDLVEFLSFRLQTLAIRSKHGKGLTRCECFGRPGRCRNFWTDEIKGVKVCTFHKYRILNGWIPILSKRGINVWEAKVLQLLYEDWEDEDQVKAIMK